MLVVTGWHLKLVGFSLTFALASVLLAQAVRMPARQVSFISSNSERPGIFVMDIDRHLIAHFVRQSLIGRQTDMAWSPDFSTIVFRAVQNITIDLYTTNIRGDQIRRLTGTGKNNHSPIFSPDGHWLAFTSERDGNPEIYITATDCLRSTSPCKDSDAKRLTNNRFADDQAAWSPDSQQIVFQSNRDGNSEIYRMNIDGTQQTRLTNDPSRDLLPNWSPDGHTIAFISERNINAELYIMNDDGSDQRRLTHTPEFEFSPQWSPDGQKLLFQRTVRGSDFETYVMDANGSHVQQLTSVQMFLQNPAWRS